jgi:hypothetical protein
VSGPSRTESTLDLRRYFLGSLSGEERDRLERDYLADPAVYEHLRAVEEELVEDYLGGRLTAQDRAGFERHFLGSPRLRLRVELTEALLQRAAGRGVIRRGRTRWTPAAWAVAASLMIAAGLGTWALVGSWYGGEAPSDVPPASPSASRSTVGTPRVARATLAPGRTRGAQRGVEVTLGGGVDVLELDLELARAEHPAYRAVIRRAEGDVVWRSPELVAQGTAARLHLTAGVPSVRLVPGDYVVTLEAAPPGRVGDLAEYFFRVLRPTPER